MVAELELKHWAFVSWFRALSNSPLISTNKARHVGSSWLGCHLSPGVLATVSLSLCQASPTLGKRGWSTRAYHGNAGIRAQRTSVATHAHSISLTSVDIELHLNSSCLCVPVCAHCIVTLIPTCRYTFKYSFIYSHLFVCTYIHTYTHTVHIWVMAQWYILKCMHLYSKISTHSYVTENNTLLCFHS